MLDEKPWHLGISGIWVLFAVSCCGGSSGTAPVVPAAPVAIYEIAQLSHIIHMGQSLGSGDDAFPLVTTSDTGFGNFQFARGVHTWREQDTAYGQSPQLRPDSDFALVPIIAGERATSTGETMASGLVDTFKASINPAIDTRFLFSFSGVGSKRLRGNPPVLH